MGFRATVENFQPFYVFSNSHMQELRVGAAILKDALELEASKVQRLGESRSREKQGAEDAIRKVIDLATDDTTHVERIHR